MRTDATGKLLKLYKGDFILQVKAPGS